MRNARLWHALFGVEKTIVEAIEFDEDAQVLVGRVRPARAAARRCGVCQRRCGRYDDPARAVDQGRLRLDFNRLKTSIDVRRTRQLGGHLPSAALSNTLNVLFSNYLRDDPTTIDWARTVVSDALADAEQAALQAHRAALLTTTGRPHLRVISADADPGQQPAVEAAWTGCADPDRHPVTGGTCRATFMDCFHCGNCVVTPAHLPRLLGLLDTLADRRRHLPDTDWWTRYGGAWTAIRHDILAKFTPAEVEAAAATKTTDSRLDLVENPWEKP